MYVDENGNPVPDPASVTTAPPVVPATAAARSGNGTGSPTPRSSNSGSSNPAPSTLGSTAPAPTTLGSSGHDSDDHDSDEHDSDEHDSDQHDSDGDLDDD
jgi:hypothetical protein